MSDDMVRRFSVMKKFRTEFCLAGYTNYEAYRASSLWAGIRKRVFRRDRKRCRVCGCKAAVAHHRNYKPETMYGKSINGIVSLCNKHHHEVHFDGDVKIPISQMGRINWKLDELIKRRGSKKSKVKDSISISAEDVEFLSMFGKVQLKPL
jgi:hypothetical protein